jgi:hypothetical protein
MLLAIARRLARRTSWISRPADTDIAAACEALEPRQLLAAFSFTTGKPDGLVGTVSEPSDTHNGNVEFETGDDFILAKETHITSATFTGLLSGGAAAKDVSNIVVEIYRVFPLDSNTNRTPGVPTRTNSPSDVAFASRNSAAQELTFKASVVKKKFTASASVFNAASIAVSSGGDGQVTGQEVQFTVKFKNNPFDLPADHYFFIPQVGLKDTAAAGAHFLWLSAAKPIVKPGKPFTGDLQSWMRDDPPLAPDWLRVGTDIIAAGKTYNAAFSLKGKT